MWNPLKTEAQDRFSAAESFLKSTRGLRGAAGQTAKGLAFVQIYAAYEYTVKNVFKTAVLAICSHPHNIMDLTFPLMGLFLNPEISALRDCDKQKVLENRTKMFENLFSGRPSINHARFPNDGSHFRHSQLQTIFDLFGIKRTPAQRQKHLHRIDALVDLRNSIAHGHETADTVGRRFTRAEILHINRQVRSVCAVLISATERQCSKPELHRRNKLKSN